jgi:transcription elongation GreA/GreB family factor
VNNKPTYLSKDGLEKLRAELEEMTNVRRPEIADRIHDAKEHGDLSENAEYEDAKNEQAFVEGRIQTLEALIKNAVLIDENHSTDHVQIGSTVSVESEDGKETFTIVGSGRGQARRRADLEREPGRSFAAGSQEGRKGRGEGAGRRLHLQDHEHHLRGTVDWADELAQRVRDAGPQVVNDSKTPSGTVHVGSLRGPVILDAITRALRANGIETTLLYGVDDLDPMDAQALLTPDAVEHEMGRPLANVPDQAGDCHASYARHHAQTFIDTFAGLGIFPDRYYWMSEHYAAGDLDPFIRTALDRAALVREIYKRVPTSSTPIRGTRSASSARTAGRSGRRSSRIGTGSACSTSAGRISSHGPGAAGRVVGYRPTVGTRSCPGTWSGRRSGRCSG